MLLSLLSSWIQHVSQRIPFTTQKMCLHNMMHTNNILFLSNRYMPLTNKLPRNKISTPKLIAIRDVDFPSHFIEQTNIFDGPVIFATNSLYVLQSRHTICTCLAKLMTCTNWRGWVRTARERARPRFGGGEGVGASGCGWGGWVRGWV